ncbi:sulfotransferase 1 family member D1 [Loxodonta africana]|uniref:sulfotransferase 1 family member D1 n=1 Tax=Loxodonta africana TaxID=9785 RepID=UPI000C813369|nr:sulfotransferase 1 family member D1 [Loxodonta africana]
MSQAMPQAPPQAILDKDSSDTAGLISSDGGGTGTTWVSEIYDLVYNNRDAEKCKWDAIHKQVPFTELIIPGLTYGIEQLKNIQSPQLVKTHLPVQLLPFSLWKNDCKMIYVAQNAKDVAVSYYYFYQMAKMHPEPDTWEEFLDKFIAGKVCFGSWYEHVKGWWEKMKDYPILYLFYEDMKEEPKKEVTKLIHFLGKKISEELVDTIVYHTSFQEMKNNPTTNYTAMPDEFMNQKMSPFMRKGIVGDWKNHFTVALNERLDVHHERE